MPVKPSHPGVDVGETSGAGRSIAPAPTSIAAFAGWAPQGPAGQPVPCLSWSDFDRVFGGLDGRSYLGYAVSHFFGNGGSQCYVIRLTAPGGGDGAVIAPGDAGFDDALMGDGLATGIYSLAQVDQFNLLNVPGYANAANLATLQRFCRDRRALLLIDSDKGSTPSSPPMTGPPDSRLTGADGINAAFYYPWLLAPDPEQQNQVRSFPPGGAVAGVYARIDASRGVWMAPAGAEAGLSGVTGVTLQTDDAENGMLNPLGVNCIRQFPGQGAVIWGARTLQGDEQNDSEWKYVPVRRMALFIEESLRRGLEWVAFEPNGEPLWAQIRLEVGSFMEGLFRQGAFQGAKLEDACFVQCDRNTTTQSDIDCGVVKVLVGFAPLKPAEFVVITLQIAAQPAT